MVRKTIITRSLADDIEAAHFANRKLTRSELAELLGCQPVYVRVVARRRGLKIPRDAETANKKPAPAVIPKPQVVSAELGSPSFRPRPGGYLKLL